MRACPSTLGGGEGVASEPRPSRAKGSKGSADAPSPLAEARPATGGAKPNEPGGVAACNPERGVS